MKNRIIPCLWFDNQAEAAAQFYTQTFPEGKITALARFPESTDNPAGKPRGSVITAEFTVAGQKFTALNGGPNFVINPSISLFVQVSRADLAETYFAQLAAGGAVLMPLAEYPWSARYGWVQDRFGVSWQVMFRPDAEPVTIYPCLMFAGPQHGKAEKALADYVRIFPNAKVNSLARYEAHEGPEGTLKHGRCTLDEQILVAMDSHMTHDITFNEGLSLQVMCSNQEEVDHYWDRLIADGGRPGPCGWLHDPYGVSWQVVPQQMAAWMTHPDQAARDRAFGAMMQMTKLDIATLEAALRGPQ